MPAELNLDSFVVARRTVPRHISQITTRMGLATEDIDTYGKFKAKFTMAAMERLLGQARRGKLVLVTAITPTKAGEGKTTVAIGLAQALCKDGRYTIAALRQPSLGPVFGKKGGATGGGYAQLVPAEDINLHFTGDFHAIAAANNLLAAMTDNSIFQGNPLAINPDRVFIRRALDMNDRALRSVTIDQGGPAGKRSTAFEITAACEVMAALCLSESLSSLKERLGRIVVAEDKNGSPVTAENLGATDAMCALLVDAMRPNIVQTLEGTPAFVHGGPFANIAHGCSSRIATQLALRLGEFVVTEAGFGADLGFEKYCDIVAASNPSELAPDVVVLIATIKALKLHGGASSAELHQPNAAQVRAGLCNLKRHAEIVSSVGVPLVVTLNKHNVDTDEEIEVVEQFCAANDLKLAVSDVWNQGGDGALRLAELVAEASRSPASFQPFYRRSLPIREKLDILGERIYCSAAIQLSTEAQQQLDWLEQHGYGNLPVCVAKTQYSLSDNPKLIGAPTGFSMHVNEFHLSAGAGFVVARMGEISTMPGLPKHPNALDIEVDAQGHVTHLG